MSKRLKGFTLIELLIVVAIIAILAAIAVPNFLEAQVRAKVSRVKADLRSLATGIESYYVDNNSYPAHNESSANYGANNFLPATTGASSRNIPTFQIRQNPVTDQLMTLTTPVAFITTLFTDPFADSKGAVFAYSNARRAFGVGWIAWSYGPDTDEKTPHATSALAGGDIGFSSAPRGGLASVSTPALTVGDTYYNPNNPRSPSLIEATYDPTNGTTSSGDVFRVKD